MNELALFAGAGGGILGGLLLGWKTVCAVEINPYCARVLMQRQNEGHLPPFPIWDDVRTFRGREWCGLVDVVSGGFPCQDISAANPLGKGLEGAKSGLWREFARCIREIQPQFAFVENSGQLTKRGLHRVLGELAEMGYDAEWGCFSANTVGAPHQRSRTYIVANSNSPRPSSQRNLGKARKASTASISSSTWWRTEPRLVRVANGVANRNDRVTALGNGQVPAVAATAWTVLKARLEGA